MRSIHSILFAILFLLVSCALPSDENDQGSASVDEEILLDYGSSTFHHIKSLEDRQVVDSLAYLLLNGSAEERLFSAKALASNPNKSSIQSLGQSLQNKDEFIDIRIAAAYALGQCFDETAMPYLLSSYERGDTTENGGRLSIFDPLNGTILEAVGKCGNLELLNNISSFSNVFETDTAILLGQARGIYRFALRGISSEDGTKRMIDVVSDPKMPADVRSIAANYLYRAKDVDLSPYTESLIPIALNNSDPRVRMCLSKALEKSSANEVYYAYDEIIKNETDYRVLVNLIRGFSSKPSAKVKPLAIRLADHSNPQVAKEALSYIIENGTSSDGIYLNKFRKNTKDPELKYLASTGANKLLSWKFALARDQLNSELKNTISGSSSTSEKIFATRALKYEVQNFNYLQSLVLNSKNKPVATAALATLGEMIVTDKFKKYFSGGYKGTLNSLGPFLLKAINKNDAGLTYEASNILKNPDLFFKNNFKRVGELKSALEKIQLPKDTEAYNSLSSAIAYLEGKDYETPSPDFNNPFNPENYSNINSNAKALIKTSRGDITVQLFPKHAPSSVANFCALANNDFYDGKNFHRVVGNFVIQGGCPRGDGYGSLDYTIRSELGSKYYDRAGYLGMASAGKNTEGTQWFITHSPTPHLDGKYSIFGEVVEGLEIVHNTRVGDTIESVEIIN